MINAWTVASIVAVVAGVVGFFTVLRGSAFVAHAIPNGSVPRGGGAPPPRGRPPPRRRRRRERARHRLARPSRSPRRRNRPRAGGDARPRGFVPEPERRVRPSG